MSNNQQELIAQIKQLDTQLAGIIPKVGSGYRQIIDRARTRLRSYIENSEDQLNKLDSANNLWGTIFSMIRVSGDEELMKQAKHLRGSLQGFPEKFTITIVHNVRSENMPYFIRAVGETFPSAHLEDSHTLIVEDKDIVFFPRKSGNSIGIDVYCRGKKVDGPRTVRDDPEGGSPSVMVAYSRWRRLLSKIKYNLKHELNND